MARARIADDTGLAAVRSFPGDRDTSATAVRYLLQLLDEKAPGNSVEVRVPPLGAVQCVEGPRHTRGTPPNVVETDELTWFDMGTGRLRLDEALADARAVGSGSHYLALARMLPIIDLSHVA